MSGDDSVEPMRVLRDWFVKSEKSWSDALSAMMGDERFATGMGRYVHEALHTHRMFAESMGQYLANLNIPSRSDILEMNDRLAHMEGMLNQIQVELRDQRGQLARVAAGTAQDDTSKRPARTRKPTPKSAT